MLQLDCNAREISTQSVYSNVSHRLESDLDTCYFAQRASPEAQLVKILPDNAGDARDVGLIPGSGRFPGEGNGNPLQYCCLENSMDIGAWQTIAVGSQESDMTEQLNNSRLSECLPLLSTLDFLVWPLVNFY